MALPLRNDPSYIGEYWEYVRKHSNLYEIRQIPRRRATRIWRFYRKVLQDFVLQAIVKDAFPDVDISEKQPQLLFYCQIPASRDYIIKILAELKKRTVPLSLLGPFILWAFSADGELTNPGPAPAKFLGHLWVCLVKQRGKSLFVFHCFELDPNNERAKRTRWVEKLHGTPEAKEVKAVFSKDEAPNVRIANKSEVRIDFWIFPPVSA